MNDDQRAAQAAHKLAQRAHTARLLGKENSLVLPGSGSVSLKVTAQDLLGEEQEILHVSARGVDLANITENDLIPVHLDGLARLTTLDALSDALLAQELAARSGGRSAPLETLMHAVLPYEYVDYICPDALLAITNTPSASKHVRQIYGDKVIVVPYARPGFALAKLLAHVFEREVNQDTAGVVLIKQGLITFGATAQSAYERAVDLVSRAQEYLLEQGAWHVHAPHQSATDAPKRRELAGLRQAVSASAGFPVIMTTCSDAQCISFARRDDLATIAQRGPATPEHARITGRLPLLGRDVAACGRGPAPRVILDPELGMCSMGRSADEAVLAGQVYRHTMDVILRAESLQAYQPASAQDVSDVELSIRPFSPSAFSPRPASAQDISDVQPSIRPFSPSAFNFAGEVALVTGAASGIGKACIESFLARGAAAVGLDLNPAVERMLARADYVGLQCDVTDEDALCAALEAAVGAFGGLDMLVLNAGVFPAGCRIESMPLDEWERVMRVNLDANVALMREAHPLLKLAPGGGRVVVNGSRNVLAPGPGAAAYSTSKAALTQLARVAAMEWGQDGIRVNVIHAHAVFDTGIWTKEVLRARAEHYGMTVEAYKTNNVLKTEITSHDVGELVAEMCGPLFAKTTGAQIPIDGGSNRVI